jgi:hypothetical protein
MKALMIAATLAMLGGCASNSTPYDAQFCKLQVRDKEGNVRCTAWAIAPYRTQMQPLRAK